MFNEKKSQILRRELKPCVPFALATAQQTSGRPHARQRRREKAQIGRAHSVGSERIACTPAPLEVVIAFRTGYPGNEWHLRNNEVYDGTQ